MNNNRYDMGKYTRIGDWGKPRAYRCNRCGHTVKTYNGLKSHLKRKHPQTSRL